jgi:hypothetical protein
MLTDLDAELFPDDCEVVDIPLHNRFIYLIQKNASTSLRLEAHDQNWSILRNRELQALDNIDVYLRDPVARYLSGMNTFVQYLVRGNPELDLHTCEVLSARHFLNRHYLPQWHWLANLARFIHPQCQIRLHKLEDLSQVTSRISQSSIVPLTKSRAAELLPSDHSMDLWFLLDRILLGECDKSLTWKDILHIYQQHPARPLQIVQERMQEIQRVLC